LTTPTSANPMLTPLKIVQLGRQSCQSLGVESDPRDTLRCKFHHSLISIKNKEFGGDKLLQI
jgi:hypothetical protein